MQAERASIPSDQMKLRNLATLNLPMMKQMSAPRKVTPAARKKMTGRALTSPFATELSKADCNSSMLMSREMPSKSASPPRISRLPYSALKR